MSKTLDVTEWFAPHHAKILQHWQEKWAAHGDKGTEVCSGNVTISTMIGQAKTSERYFLRDEGTRYHANWMEFPDTPVAFSALGWIGEDRLEFISRNWIMRFDSIGQPQGTDKQGAHDENKLYGFGFSIVRPTKTTDYSLEYNLGGKTLYVFNPEGYDKATLSVEKVGEQWIAKVEEGSYLSECQVKRKISRKATGDVRSQFSEKRDLFAMAATFADSTPYLIKKEDYNPHYYHKTDSAKLLKIVEEAGENWINEAARELGYGHTAYVPDGNDLLQQFDKDVHAVDWYKRPVRYIPDFSNTTTQQLKTRFESAIKKAVKEAYGSLDGAISYVNSETKEVVYEGKLDWDDR